MDTDNVLCKVFKLHSYKEVLNNKKYLISKCPYCDKYKITHKDYKMTFKYKKIELPDNFKKLLA